MDFTAGLKSLQGKDRLVLCEPEVLDFTSNNKPAKLVIMSPDIKIEINFPKKRKEFKEILGYLDTFLFSDIALSEKNLTLGWNIKSFFSYVRGRSEENFCLNGKILDIKLLEAFLGCNERNPPLSFSEAMDRMRSILKHPSWSNLKPIYSKIHLPLITETLPRLETAGLADQKIRRNVYSSYEIEGQANGRLKCQNNFVYSFNPHTLSVEEKQYLQPTCYEDCFLYFDYKHYEVSILQWLSGDEALLRALNSGDDLYRVIWKMMRNTDDCSDKEREFCKRIFLPVVFGQGVDSLVESTKMPESTAKMLVDSIYRIFKSALDWVRRAQALDADGFCTDYFGRRRNFSSYPHKARNFVIQAPASIISLDKLIKLEKKVREEAAVVAHIHDGYLLTAKNKDIPRLYRVIKDVLETDDELYPGLKLKTVCTFGKDLNDLKAYK